MFTVHVFYFGDRRLFERERPPWTRAQVPAVEEFGHTAICSDGGAFRRPSAQAPAALLLPRSWCL